MLLAKAVLFLVVIAAAVATSAAAQTVPLRNVADGEERPMVEQLEGGPIVRGVQPTPRLVRGATAPWLREYVPSDTAARAMTLFAPQALPPGARFVTPRSPAARILRVINGRFVPIPGLQWRMRAPLEPRATMAVCPSIFIGRRPTFMPEGFRGGRTFGFAVHLRITLAPSVAAPQSAAASSGTALLTSRLRSLLVAR